MRALRRQMRETLRRQGRAAEIQQRHGGLTAEEIAHFYREGGMTQEAIEQTIFDLERRGFVVEVSPGRYAPRGDA